MSTQSAGTVWQRWMAFLLNADGGRGQVASAGAGPVTVQLLRNGLVHLQKDRGVRVLKVRHGIVWLTGTPASADVILHRGDRYLFDDSWPFVLQAMEDAEFELSA